MKAQKLTKETVMNIAAVDRGFPYFRVGDTIKISLMVKEGDKERVQLFTGDVIAMHRNGIGSTFTVRRISANNIGVEKIFPYYSPTIADIKILSRGNVRRAKLFYIRELVGKAARIKEKVLTKEQKEQLRIKSKKRQEVVKPTEKATE